MYYFMTLKKYRKAIKNILMFALFTFYLLFSFYFILRAGTILYFNSDTSADIMHFLASKELDSVSPDGWLGGSQFHVNTLLFYPASKISGNNLLLCRNLSSFFMTIALFGSIVFFSKSVFHNNSWIIIIPILFSSLFPQMTRLYIYYAEYTAGMILLLLVISCLNISTDGFRKIQNKRWFIVTVILIFLSCILGTQGLQLVTIPVAGTIFLDSILYKRPALCNAVKMCGIIALASLAGVVLYSFVIQQKNGINGLSNLLVLKTKEDYRSIGELIRASLYFWIWGNEINSSFMIHYARIVCRIIGSTLLIFIIPFAYYWKNVHYFNEPKRGIIIPQVVYCQMAFISFFEILCIFLFSRAYTSGQQVRYFTNPFFLLACIGVNVIYEKLVNGNKITTITSIIMLALVITVNGSAMYIPYEEFCTEYKKMSDIGEFLENNNLTFGFSSYWNASVNTAITNGNVYIMNLHLNGRNIEVQGQHTLIQWYDPGYHSGKTFLLLTESEYKNEYWNEFAYEVCGAPIDELKHDGMHILVYDYNIVEKIPII